MRRIATIAATGAAAAAVIAHAVPANAATTNTGNIQNFIFGNVAASQTAAPAAAATKWHNWTARSYSEGSAWGTYAKVGKTVYIYGRVHDNRTDNLRTCIAFVWYYHGKAVNTGGADAVCGPTGRAGTARFPRAIKGPTYANSLYDRILIVKGNKAVGVGPIHKIY